MSIEKIINWVCLAFVAAVAAMLSLHIFISVLEGSIRTASKAGTGTLYVLAENPFGFWLAVIPHLFLNGIAWYLTYWTYTRRISCNYGGK